MLIVSFVEKLKKIEIYVVKFLYLLEIYSHFMRNIPT